MSSVEGKSPIQRREEEKEEKEEEEEDRGGKAARPGERVDRQQPRAAAPGN